MSEPLETASFKNIDRHTHMRVHTHTHTHTHTTILWPSGLWDYPGVPVPEPIWILLKQEAVSGSGISQDTCRSASHPDR